jgi:hypothetical protein
MGLLNEHNETNIHLAELYGIAADNWHIAGNEVGPGTNEIAFIKQDLAYVDELSMVTPTPPWPHDPTPLAVVGEMAVLSLTGAGAKASETLATFSDGTAALYRQRHGRGSAVVCAFHLVRETRPSKHNIYYIDC